MKRILLIVLAGFGALTGCIRIDESSPRMHSSDQLNAVTNLTQRGEIPTGIGALHVENQFGLVRVTGTDEGAGGWSWNLTVHARSDDLAAQAASEAICRAEKDGARWRIVVLLPKSRVNVSYRSDLEIRVPRSMAVEAQNRFGRTELSDLAAAQVDAQNGAVEINKITGAVRAQTAFELLSVKDAGEASLRNQNGKIEVQQVRGALTAETSFASLLAADIRGLVKLKNQNGLIELVDAAGDVDLSTSFGRLSVERVRGNANLANQNGPIKAREIGGSVSAHTSFGELAVEAAGPNCSCRNQNGPIYVRATSLALTNLEAQTSFAALDVRLPAALQPAVVAHTSFGEVESDFPVLMKPTGVDPFADVVAGTPRVRLHNQNGGIRVIRE